MKRLLPVLVLLFFLQPLFPYPIDGYDYTGIRRLIQQRAVMEDSIRGRRIPPGALKYRNEIELNLVDRELPETDSLMTTTDNLQRDILKLLPNLGRAYSVALMDITPGRDIAYAEYKPDNGYQPGSVGKLAVITGLFCELENLFPDFEQRMIFLKNHKVKANDVGIPDHHTVPFYDTEREKFYKRHLRSSDEFSLYEWADHVMSVSSNGAASVVWRELVLMRHFAQEYPVSEERAEEFFRTYPRKNLSEYAVAVVNEPLRELGIGKDEWRLGSLFTRTGKRKIPGGGGSIGTPKGLMKWMVALERGDIVDRESSLEFKRLMYMTDRRIRYAKSNALDSAAVYFKSGSFYSCDRTKNPNCGKYRGNRYNYMNSVCIVEQPDGNTYLVALMTNVLNRNSAYDHYILARRFDNAIRGLGPVQREESEADVMKVVDGGGEAAVDDD